jgi:glycine betaine transporter
MTGLYLLSSLKGLKSGIQFFSNLSLWGSVVLLALVTCFGPKAGLGLPVLASLPSFLANLGPWSLGLADYRDPFWVRDWTMKYWSWWLAWAPFVGMFIALISKGRTVREFVGGVLLAPTLFSVLWFFVFGEAAIALARQAHGHPLLTGLGDTGNVLYWVVGSLPGGQWLNLLCLLLISLFFINSADSATYTLAALARGRLQEPPPALAQIAWGVLLAVLASLFLFSGGIGLLQQVTLVSVLPFSILLVMILGRLGLVLFRISLLKPEESKQLPESRFRPRLAAVRPRLSVE